MRPISQHGNPHRKSAESLSVFRIRPEHGTVCDGGAALCGPVSAASSAVLLLQHNEPVREIETAVPETGKETGASQRVEEKGQAAAKPGLSLPALLPFLCLLILCLLVVFRIVPYVPVLICVAAAVLVINKRLFLSWITACF